LDLAYGIGVWEQLGELAGSNGEEDQLPSLLGKMGV
jgi:hypothetical protein